MNRANLWRVLGALCIGAGVALARRQMLLGIIALAVGIGFLLLTRRERARLETTAKQAQPPRYELGSANGQREISVRDRGIFFFLATLNFTSHHTLTGVGFAVAAVATLAAGWQQYRAKATPAQRSEPDPD